MKENNNYKVSFTSSKFYYGNYTINMFPNIVISAVINAGTKSSKPIMVFGTPMETTTTTRTILTI